MIQDSPPRPQTNTKGSESLSKTSSVDEYQHQNSFWVSQVRVQVQVCLLQQQLKQTEDFFPIMHCGSCQLEIRTFIRTTESR